MSLEKEAAEFHIAMCNMANAPEEKYTNEKTISYMLYARYHKQRIDVKKVVEHVKELRHEHTDTN